MRDKRFGQLCEIAIIVVFILAMIPLIRLSFYAHPSADDFNYSILTYHKWNETHSMKEVLKSAVETSKNFWHTWQGLYASAFFLSLQPAIFGEQYYALTGIIMLTLIIGSNFIFCNYFIKNIMDGTMLQVCSFTSIISLLMIEWMPCCVEGIYWFNGAINYGMFHAFLMVYICLLFELIRQGNPAREMTLFCGGVVLAVLIEGGNHVTALMGIVFSFCAMVMAVWLRKWRKAAEGVILFVLMLVCLRFNITSPGTAIRQSNFSKMGIPESIYKSLLIGTGYISSWIGVATIAMVILMFPLIIKVVNNYQKKGSFGFKYPLVLFVGSVAWLCAMLCPVFYATGSAGAGRLTNIIYYHFILLLFVNAFYGAGWILRKINDENREKILKYRHKWYVVAVLLIGIFLAEWKNSCTFKAMDNLRFNIPQVYSQMAYERVNEYLNSTGMDVEVEAYFIKPEMLFFDDITEEERDWRNVSVKDYYDLASVRISVTE